MPNLAPYSFFTVASRNPRALCMSVGERASGEPLPKDALCNIEETGEPFVNGDLRPPTSDQDAGDPVRIFSEPGPSYPPSGARRALTGGRSAEG